MKKYDFDDLYEGPRLERMVRKRKIQKKITLLIIVMITLALFLVVKITSENEVIETDVASYIKDTSSIKAKKLIGNEFNDDQSKTEKEDKVGNSNDEEVKEESEPDVIGERSNEWSPVGTTQTEPHITSFEKDSVDWNEMIKAIELATNLTKEEMILWWLGNAGGADQSEAIITTKDQNQVYKVQMTWVTNEGWMPTSVNELDQNPYDQNKNENDNEEVEE